MTVCTVVKSKVKISQNFLAFSEYMNFTIADFLSFNFPPHGTLIGHPQSEIRFGKNSAAWYILCTEEIEGKGQKRGHYTASCSLQSPQ